MISTAKAIKKTREAQGMTQKVLKIAMLSSYVCVLSTVFCAIIAGFKGV